jgi:hypothetical protein
VIHCCHRFTMYATTTSVLFSPFEGLPWRAVSLRFMTLTASVGFPILTWMILIHGSDHEKLHDTDLQVMLIFAGSIQELGRFYTTNGQRARLSSETGKAILEKLNAASAALPM